MAGTFTSSYRRYGSIAPSARASPVFPSARRQSERSASVVAAWSFAISPGDRVLRFGVVQALGDVAQTERRGVRHRGVGRRHRSPERDLALHGRLRRQTQRNGGLAAHVGGRAGRLARSPAPAAPRRCPPRPASRGGASRPPRRGCRRARIRPPSTPRPVRRKERAQAHHRVVLRLGLGAAQVVDEAPVAHALNHLLVDGAPPSTGVVEVALALRHERLLLGRDEPGENPSASLTSTSVALVLFRAWTRTSPRRVMSSSSSTTAGATPTRRA